MPFWSRSSDTGHVIPTESQQYDIDAAETELDRIIAAKKELEDYLLDLQHRFPEADAKCFLFFEDPFDDAFHEVWHAHQPKASIGYPARIPPFGALHFETPKQRKDREWSERQ